MCWTLADSRTSLTPGGPPHSPHAGRTYPFPRAPTAALAWASAYFPRARTAPVHRAISSRHDITLLHRTRITRIHSSATARVSACTRALTIAFAPRAHASLRTAFPPLAALTRPPSWHHLLRRSRTTHGCITRRTLLHSRLPISLSGSRAHARQRAASSSARTPPSKIYISRASRFSTFHYARYLRHIYFARASIARVHLHFSIATFHHSSAPQFTSTTAIVLPFACTALHHPPLLDSRSRLRARHERVLTILHSALRYRAAFSSHSLHQTSAIRLTRFISLHPHRTLRASSPTRYIAPCRI